MLVRNLTKVSLPLRKHGQKIVLLPGKVTEVPDVMFTKEQIKNIYGSFVQILNDKLVQEPVVEQTIEIKVEKTQVEEAFNETLKKSEEAKEEAPATPAAEEVKEEAPATPVAAEVKEEAPAAEEVKAELTEEEAPVASDDFEEVCLEGIAELAEEIIEEAKEVPEEKPAKKATKKATAKKTTKKK